MTFDDVLGFVLWIVLLAFGAAVVETWWERGLGRRLDEGT